MVKVKLKSMRNFSYHWTHISVIFDQTVYTVPNALGCCYLADFLIPLLKMKKVLAGSDMTLDVSMTQCLIC